MSRNTFMYTALVVAFLAAVWAILGFGEWIHPGSEAAPTIRAIAAPEETSAIVTLIVQIGVILVASRLMGLACKAIGQPQVIGEMLAGIMLGPSLLKAVQPELFNAIFPTESLGALGLLSQLGVILFLFLIGLELDPKLLRSRGHAAVLISHASIAVPFVLGVGLTLYLFPRFSEQPDMQFAPVALFMGAAMSVTAFPVLARMLTERNMHRTELGAVAITCAAVDDATAWCMLAIVIGVARADGIVPGLITAGMATAYVVAMLTLVRPLLRKLQRVYERQGRLSQGMVGGILVLLLSSAWVTEKIGIHALFGAFMMGAMMPNGTQFVRSLSDKIEDFTVTFLLPIFFAYAGLKTEIGLISTPQLWMETLLIILVACVGKFGGSAIAARVSGMSWRDSWIIGALMNTRGLMELVILQIGLAEGVLTPTVFAMMVIMALVTTAMTAPMLSILVPKSQSPAVAGRSAGFDVLVPVAAPESGRGLARLAGALLGAGDKTNGKLLPLHLVRPEDERFGSGLEEIEHRRLEALEPILTESQRLRISTEPVSFPSTDVPADIAAVARGRGVGLVLMGFHKPVFGTEVLGGVVHRVLETGAADTAVFIDRGLIDLRRVLVALIGSANDTLALTLAERMSRLAGTAVTVLHVVPSADTERSRLDAKGAISKTFPSETSAAAVTLRVVMSDDPVGAVLKECPGHDLLLIGVDEQVGLESHLFGWRPQRVVDDCPISLLIVRRRASQSPKGLGRG